MSRVGLVAALVAIALAASAHAEPLTLGQPFTLAGPVKGGAYSGALLLGANGTLWLAQPGTGGARAAFTVVARAADGRLFGPFVVPRTRATPAVDVPRGALAADGSVTFAWEEASGLGDDNPRIAVRAVRCTTRGCGAAHTFWDEQMHGDVGSFSFNLDNPPAEPAIASVGTATVIVYMREVHSGTAGAVEVSGRMTWAVESRGRFGAPHAFRWPYGDIDPVLVAEPGGRLLAAWLGLIGNTSAVVWAHGSAAHGFGAPKALRGSSGDGSNELVAAPTAGGALLAWLQGSSANLDPTVGFYPYPVWTATDTGAGLSKPVRVLTDNAYGLTLAAGGGASALSLSDNGSSEEPPPSAPALVMWGSGPAAPSGTPVTLDPAALTSPAVAFDSSGAALAAWRSGAGDELAQAPAGAAFSQPPVPIADQVRGSPELVTGPAGSFVAWAAVQGRSIVIQAAQVTP